MDDRWANDNDGTIDVARVALPALEAASIASEVLLRSAAGGRD
jgi:hypothetical protein